MKWSLSLYETFHHFIRWTESYRKFLQKVKFISPFIVILNDECLTEDTIDFTRLKVLKIFDFLHTHFGERSSELWLGYEKANNLTRDVCDQWIWNWCSECFWHASTWIYNKREFITKNIEKNIHIILQVCISIITDFHCLWSVVWWIYQNFAFDTPINTTITRNGRSFVSMYCMTVL